MTGKLKVTVAAGSFRAYTSVLAFGVRPEKQKSCTDSPRFKPPGVEK